MPPSRSRSSTARPLRRSSRPATTPNPAPAQWTEVFGKALVARGRARRARRRHHRRDEHRHRPRAPAEGDARALLRRRHRRAAGDPLRVRASRSRASSRSRRSTRRSCSARSTRSSTTSACRSSTSTFVDGPRRPRRRRRPDAPRRLRHRLPALPAEHRPAWRRATRRCSCTCCAPRWSTTTARSRCATRAAPRSACRCRPSADPADRDRHRRDPARGLARRAARLRHRRREVARGGRPARRAAGSTSPSPTRASPSRSTQALLAQLAAEHELLVTVEEGVLRRRLRLGRARAAERRRRSSTARASCASGCPTATSPTASRRCCTARSASPARRSPSGSSPRSAPARASRSVRHSPRLAAEQLHPQIQTILDADVGRAAAGVDRGGPRAATTARRCSWVGEAEEVARRLRGRRRRGLRAALRARTERARRDPVDPRRRLDHGEPRRRTTRCAARWPTATRRGGRVGRLPAGARVAVPRAGRGLRGARCAWLAERYPGEPLAIAGDSAGGNLATVVARRARDAGGPELRFQLLVYPATDAACATGSYQSFGADDAFGLEREEMLACWAAYAPGAAPALARRLAAARGDLQRLPPALLVLAECDPLTDEAHRLRRPPAGRRRRRSTVQRLAGDGPRLPALARGGRRGARGARRGRRARRSRAAPRAA